MMNFGTMNMGGGDGAGMQGPWLEWKPEGDATWNIPHKSFCARGCNIVDLKERSLVDPYIVFDVHNIRVGWNLFTGGAPKWVWADSGTLNVGPKPDHEGGDRDWQPGFCLPALVTINKAPHAVKWSQTGRGAVTGFEHLIRLMQATPPESDDQLPVVRVSNTEPIKGFKTTFAPIFELAKWVNERPDLLPNADPVGVPPPAAPRPMRQAAAPARPSLDAVAVATAAQAPVNGSQAPTHAPAVADFDDEIPF